MKTLVVGSSVIDFFFTLNNPSDAPISDSHVTLALGDKVPVSIKSLTLGGNGSNVSVGLTRLGLITEFYTYLGSDILSNQVEQTLQQEGVHLLTHHEKNETTSLSVILDFSVDRIIFSHHQLRDHTFSYPESKIPDFIYLTSIGNEWENAYENLVTFSKTHNIPLAFSPGSHQMHEINSTFLTTLESATMLFVNREEAEKIAATKFPISKDTDIKQLLLTLKHMGPHVVSITDGGKGAYAIDEDNSMFHILPFLPDEEVIEKTGAGDSYASGLLASYLHGNSLEDSMKWGGINAHSVMMYYGAQPGLLHTKLMHESILKYTDYRSKKIG